MAIFQSKKVSLDQLTSTDGRNHSAAPFPWIETYNITDAVAVSPGTTPHGGARAAGDIDEIMILRPGHIITDIRVVSENGISSTDIDCDVGIINGDVGDSPTTARTIEPGGVSLDSKTVSGAFTAVGNDPRMLLNVDNKKRRAVGIRWQVARVKTPNNGNKDELTLAIFICRQSFVRG